MVFSMKLIALLTSSPFRVALNSRLTRLFYAVSRTSAAHLVNPGVPRSVSCAKYAAAFLRYRAPCEGEHSLYPTVLSPLARARFGCSCQYRLHCLIFP
jgi:hypothetical protein